MKLMDNLILDIEKNELVEITIHRLKNFFVLSQEEILLIRQYHDNILLRVYNCFRSIDNKYYHTKEGNVYFSYCHSGHYLAYLYFYSNEFSKVNSQLMDKFYYLNKIMNSVDIYGAVELPESFFFEHPIGTVLGRAIYGNNFFAMQGCTVGGNKNCYPFIGENVKMFSNSKILGNSKIGDNVWISANTYVKDQDIPSNTIVFGSSPNLIIKEKK